MALQIDFAKGQLFIGYWANPGIFESNIIQSQVGKFTPAEIIWRFPKMGIPPNHLSQWDCPLQPSKILGMPIFRKPPIFRCSRLPKISISHLPHLWPRHDHGRARATKVGRHQLCASGEKRVAISGGKLGAWWVVFRPKN